MNHSITSEMELLNRIEELINSQVADDYWTIQLIELRGIALKIATESAELSRSSALEPSSLSMIDDYEESVQS